MIAILKPALLWNSNYKYNVNMYVDMYVNMYVNIKCM